VKDIANKIITNNLRTTVLQHELPEIDLTQGRGTPDKNFVFKSVSFIFLLFACFVCLFQLNSHQIIVDKSFIRSFKPQT